MRCGMRRCAHSTRRQSHGQGSCLRWPSSMCHAARTPWPIDWPMPPWTNIRLDAAAPGVANCVKMDRAPLEEASERMGVTKAERPPVWPLPGARRPSGPTSAGAPRARGTARGWLWLAIRVLLVLVILLSVGITLLLWRLGATVTSYSGAHFNSGRTGIGRERGGAGGPHTAAE